MVFSSCGGILELQRGIQDASGVGPGKSNLPFELRRQTPVFLPGKFYGQRNLAGNSPWGHKEQRRLSTSAHMEKGQLEISEPGLQNFFIKTGNTFTLHHERTDYFKKSHFLSSGWEPWAVILGLGLKPGSISN